MTFPSKNYNLAIATIVSISTIAIAAVAQADPNPYIQENLNTGIKTSAPPEDPNNQIDTHKQNIQKKIKVVQPNQVTQPGANQSFVKEGGPIFVKDGSKLPGIDKVTQPGSVVKPGKVMQPGANQSFVKESGPIFVKDGSKLPGIDKVTQPGAAKSHSKSFPSAVEIEQEIRSTETK
ncbi:hypothetical protein [Chamaesiphon sp.]|uniref:hypothetical protein n=1 Tax=Chamaesiphon sp. TaxID=2814140 RepID=UPI003594657E